MTALDDRALSQVFLHEAAHLSRRDDCMVAITREVRPYASCLTQVAEFAGGFGRSPVAAAAIDEHSHLTRRVEMLLDKARQTRSKLMKMRFASSACAIALLGLISARSPNFFLLAAPPAQAMVRVPSP